MLADVANQPLNVHAASQHAQTFPGGCAAADALAQSREHFSKLKFNLVELETKRRFLELLAAYDPAGSADALPAVDGACGWPG